MNIARYTLLAALVLGAISNFAAHAEFICTGYDCNSVLTNGNDTSTMRSATCPSGYSLVADATMQPKCAKSDTIIDPTY